LLQEPHGVNNLEDGILQIVLMVIKYFNMDPCQCHLQPLAVSLVYCSHITFYTKIHRNLNLSNFLVFTNIKRYFRVLRVVSVFCCSLL
jgi:hypothetical protein